MKEMLKTLLNGIKQSIPKKLSDLEDIPDAEAAFELSVELGLIEPTVAEDGSIYTDENGIIYSL